jgi:hypothetical protein
MAYTNLVEDPMRGAIMRGLTQSRPWLELEVKRQKQGSKRNRDMFNRNGRGGEEEGAGVWTLARATQDSRWSPLHEAAEFQVAVQKPISYMTHTRSGSTRKVGIICWAPWEDPELRCFEQCRRMAS